MQVNYVGNRDKNKPLNAAGYNFYESPYDGYTLVDLITNIDSQYGHFTIGIDNLLNKNYQPLVSQLNKNVAIPAYRSQFSGYGRRFTLEYSVKY